MLKKTFTTLDESDLDKMAQGTVPIAVAHTHPNSNEFSDSDKAYPVKVLNVGINLGQIGIGGIEMFKKVTFLILIIMVVSSMGSCKKQSDTTEQTGSEIEYTIISPENYNLNVKEGKGAIIRDYVDDPVVAQAIGDAVIKSIVGEIDFSNLITVSIKYDESNEIWLITTCLGSDVMGGDYTCAIRKSNGEILMVLAGE